MERWLFINLWAAFPKPRGSFWVRFGLSPAGHPGQLCPDPLSMGEDRLCLPCALAVPALLVASGARAAAGFVSAREKSAF